jgi:hypothetical protein
LKPKRKQLENNLFSDNQRELEDQNPARVIYFLTYTLSFGIKEFNGDWFLFISYFIFETESEICFFFYFSKYFGTFSIPFFVYALSRDDFPTPDIYLLKDYSQIQLLLF